MVGDATGTKARTLNRCQTLTYVSGLLHKAGSRIHAVSPIIAGSTDAHTGRQSSDGSGQVLPRRKKPVREVTASGFCIHKLFTVNEQVCMER